ncbi:hypothetical protein [Candidatus Methylomirabilis sp.]|uniref:Spy/CpxP family protein refolding chaperone n=1 Tax=Candidatus Methylomirabilis sp. TaxID=2032687 RepID=UPI0030760381
MKLLAGLLVAALLVIVPGVQSASAEEGSRGMGGMKESCDSREAGHAQYRHYGHYPYHLIRYAKEIGLIPDQVTRIKKIRLEFERACLRARAEIGVSDLEIAALMDDEKAAIATIEAKVKQRATAATGLQVAAIRAKRDAMALLTAEQREKDQAIHEKMMEQMQERRGGMGGGSMMQGGGMGGGRMGGGMMQGGEQMEDGMDHDMMQGDQDDSSQQKESQGEHQGH